MFDGRNKQYGAYVMRQETGKRNFWSMVGILLLGVLIYAGLTLKNMVDEANARALANQAAELSALEMAEETKKDDEPKVERQEIKQEEIQEVVEEVKSSTAFQVPEIKPDDMVKNPPKSMDEIMQDDRSIGSYEVEGNSDNGVVLQAQQATPEEVKEEPVVVKEEPPVVEDKVFDVVEQMPSFPGGPSALMQYLASNIKYPVVAQENGVQGRVIVGFVVGKDGSIKDVKVIKGVDPSLDREAERVVKSMPKWIPGKQNGQEVTVKYNVPVSFKLQ